MIQDIPAHDPVKDIGKTLKRIRFERNLTLENVADATGVSKAMLGQIERGASNPTISVLWKITTGLQLSLSTLFTEPIRKYNAVHILNDMTPVYDENKKMTSYILFPFDPVNGFEYSYVTLQPGALHQADSRNTNAIEEYLIITEGTLSLSVGDQDFCLEAPSKINFHASVPHVYVNNTEKPVVFQCIMKY